VVGSALVSILAGAAEPGGSVEEAMAATADLLSQIRQGIDSLH